MQPSEFSGRLKKIAFNREKARELALTIHFDFTGRADLAVRADTQAWLKIASRESSSLWPVLSGKLKIRGNPLRLMQF